MKNDRSIIFAPEEIVLGESEGRRVASLRGGAHCWAVNTVAYRLLEMLSEPQTVAVLSTQIAGEFDIDVADCQAALAPCLNSLEQSGWIETLEEMGPEADMRRRYLNLLKHALVNLLYPEHELRMRYLAEAGPPRDRQARDRDLRDIRLAQPAAYTALIRSKHCGGVTYGEPTRDSHTMVGLLRLNNLEFCARRVFADFVPGDFLEAGVCQGGAAIFLRGLQVAFGEEARRTWVADSFQGLPPPSLPQDTGMDFSEARFPWLAIGESSVKENFRTYDLLSDRVRFVSGWFEDTLPQTPTGPLALLRIDADLYQSTRDVLEALYDRVSPGGYVVVDDYGGFDACRTAVDEFRQRRMINAPLRRIDWTGVFWRKI